MYLNIFGGSALLHLLLGYPRVILALGIAGAVAATNAPLGPGRHLGTAHYLAQLDASIGNRVGNSDASETAARQSVTDLLEAYDPATIENAVADTLRACGPGCTDLSTPIVIRDPELLRRVLLIYQLDRLATRHDAASNSPEDDRPAAVSSRQ
jgi:hypothetical protein